MIWRWQEFYQQQYDSVAFEPEALKSIPVLPHTSQQRARKGPGTCGLTQGSPVRWAVLSVVPALSLGTHWFTPADDVAPASHIFTESLAVEKAY